MELRKTTSVRFLADPLDVLLQEGGVDGARENFKTVFGEEVEGFLHQQKYLDFGSDKCNTVEKLIAVARVLATNVEIVGWDGRLYLAENGIMNIDELATALTTNKTLGHLSLEYNKIESVETLTAALKDNTTSTLHRLWLGGNPAPEASIKECVAIVQKNTELRWKIASAGFLADPSLLQEGGVDGARENFKAVFGEEVEAFLHHRKHLDLSTGKCKTVKKLIAVARILASNVEIVGWNGTLSLGRNEIPNIDALAVALKTNKTLVELSLECNKIESVETLVSNTTDTGLLLTTISWLDMCLAENGITNIDKLATALTTNKTFGHLSLEYNKIESVETLTAALQDNTTSTLHRLWLGGNVTSNLEFNVQLVELHNTKGANPNVHDHHRAILARALTNEQIKQWKETYGAFTIEVHCKRCHPDTAKKTPSVANSSTTGNATPTPTASTPVPLSPSPSPTPLPSPSPSSSPSLSPSSSSKTTKGWGCFKGCRPRPNKKKVHPSLPHPLFTLSNL